MKTLATKMRNTILSGLLFITFSAMADGKTDTACNNDQSEALNLQPLTEVTLLPAPVMSPAPMMAWMIEATEPELEVPDLEATYEMRPLWTIDANETELKVEDYKPTEAMLPFWMIVEPEVELEVTDLALTQ